MTLLLTNYIERICLEEKNLHLESVKPLQTKTIACLHDYGSTMYDIRMIYTMLKKIEELGHSKRYKLVCVPSKDSDQISLQSDSLCKALYQALKYLKISTCPASQKLLAYMGKYLIFIRNIKIFTCRAA